MTTLKPAPTAPLQASDIHIVVSDNGPYLLYGAPYIEQQVITPDEMDESWLYRSANRYPTQEESPTSLCRCGASHNKPYCDGSHTTAQWDHRLTAPIDRILDGARYFEGEGLLLSDNERYCCYARFCHPGGGAWHLTKESEDEESRKLAIREASMCPSARLMAWGRGEETPYEFDFEPSVAILEDPAAECSAGLWLRGGVAVKREDGEEYELRNRVVLCRCGESHNKPYCDGSHAAIKWHDGLNCEPNGAEIPEGELQVEMI